MQVFRFLFLLYSSSESEALTTDWDMFERPRKMFWNGALGQLDEYLFIQPCFEIFSQNFLYEVYHPFF